MNNLVWLTLHTPEGKTILVCANNILYCETDMMNGTSVLIYLAGSSCIFVRETLEEIAILLE